MVRSAFTIAYPVQQNWFSTKSYQDCRPNEWDATFGRSWNFETSSGLSFTLTAQRLQAELGHPGHTRLGCRQWHNLLRRWSRSVSTHGCNKPVLHSDCIVIRGFRKFFWMWNMEQMKYFENISVYLSAQIRYNIILCLANPHNNPFTTWLWFNFYTAWPALELRAASLARPGHTTL